MENLLLFEVLVYFSVVPDDLRVRLDDRNLGESQ